MRTKDIAHIDLSKLAGQLARYENLWIAVSTKNKIVASGRTYGETVEQVADTDSVVLLKVPPLDVALAPVVHEV